MWIWHKNGGQRKEWELAQGAGSRPGNHQVRCGEGGSHHMQIGDRMITSSQLGRELFVRTLNNFPVPTPGKVNDLTFGQQVRKAAQNSHIDRPRTFAPAKHEKDRQLAGNTEVLMGGLSIPERKLRSDRVSGLVHSFVKELL